MYYEHEHTFCSCNRAKNVDQDIIGIMLDYNVKE